jgi:hypothetical protein
MRKYRGAATLVLLPQNTDQVCVTHNRRASAQLATLSYVQKCARIPDLEGTAGQCLPVAHFA